MHGKGSALKGADSLDLIYGGNRSPYFIYTPRWISSSAGIKALHYFCHSLNSKGARAYLVLSESQFQNEPRVNPNLFTPILTQEVADAFHRSGLTPVVIYSETVPGNPLNASFVVRYLMNFAGHLGGPQSFDESEMVVAFSQKISQDYSLKNNLPEPRVLFLPPVDPREFAKQEEKQKYQVVYAGKYRSFIGKPPAVGELESVEIYRDGPKMQTRLQVKEILKNASILYSFENSSIATEAILSGTPVRFVPNQFLGEVIAEVELGNGGVVQGEDSFHIEDARASIDTAIEKYTEQISNFYDNLDQFIIATQLRAKRTGSLAGISVPDYKHLVNKHRLLLAKQIAQNQGLRTLLGVTYHFLLRRLSWRYWAKTSD